MDESSRKWRAGVAPAAVILVLAGLSLAQLRGGAIYYDKWMQDVFIPMEGVRHLEAGHRLHTDFATPVGALYYGLHYLASRLSPLAGHAVVIANAIVGVLVAATVMLSARARATPWWQGAMLGLFVGLLAISPRQLGEPLQVATFNASYNRYSWAIIAALAFVALVPRARPGRAGDLVDGGVAAALLAALFYLKATYFLVGGGLVAGALVTTRLAAPWRFAIGAAAGFVALMAGIELLTGLTLPYLADIKAAAAAQTDGLRVRQFQTLALYSYAGAVVVLIVGVLRWRRVGALWAQAAPTLAGLAVVAAGVAIGTQNHLALENPLLPLGGLIAWGGVVALRPGEGERAQAPGGVAGLAALVGVVALFLTGVAQDGLGATWSAVAPRKPLPELSWLAATPARDIAVKAQPSRLQGGEVPADPELRNDVEYGAVLADGAALLQRHPLGRPATVLPFTFSNPFPTLLGTRPPRHELAWWDAGRSFSATHAPDPTALFAEVDFVLIPKAYYNYYSTVAMRQVYGETLARDYVKVEESAFWTLWQRRASAPL